MSSLTIELVSNASVQLFPDNTLSSCTNFLPEQLNVESEWEVAVLESSLPSFYQNVTGGKSCFLRKTFRSRRKSTIWNLAFTPLLQILLKL